MTTLTVGINQQYARIADATAAAVDGDVVLVQAGTYIDDFTTINHKITLLGVGGMVKMTATKPPPNGKAILTTNTDVTIDHFEFSGARVADQNGAGIRYQGGHLTINNSYFHDNENGLLAGPDTNGIILIRNSEFAHNGHGDGRSHNLYVGKIKQLTIQDSYFHDAVVGHEIKSRALNTTITGSRIQNNFGNASYEIDLPQGGNALIEGNVIQQGPDSENPTVIAFGAEGNLNPSSSLVVRGNIIMSDRANGTAVWNATGATATMVDNKVYGFGGTLNRGAVGQTSTTTLASRPTLSLASPIDADTAIPPVTPTLDSLVLHISGDAYQGDAQFTVSVDGNQVGGVMTATAAHGLGQTQDVTVSGNLGAGPHVVSVAFLNDAYGGSTSTDRNLHVDGIDLNGTAIAGSTQHLFSAGASAVTFGGADETSVSFSLSEDAWAGDAQAYVSIDGQRIGGLQTITASHALGQTQQMSFMVQLPSGPHTASVEFVNDAWGGTATTDRNLHIDSIDVGGKNIAVGAAMYQNEMQTFALPATSTATLGALTIESGPAHAVTLLPGY